MAKTLTLTKAEMQKAFEAARDAGFEAVSIVLAQREDGPPLVTIQAGQEAVDLNDPWAVEIERHESATK